MLLLALAAGLATCTALVRRAQHPNDDAPLEPPSLELELSGCAAMRDGPICELPEDGALRAWVRAPPDAVTFTTPAGAAAATTLRELDGGALHRVIVPGGATELRATVKGSEKTRAVRLAPHTAPPWLARAKTARQQGDTEGAAALVRAAEGRRSVSRAFALGMRAPRVGGRAAGGVVPLLRESVRLHRRAGRLSDAADDSFALAFALNQRSHRYAEARAVLDDVRAWVADYPDGLARESYFRGTLATETGDARAAFHLLRDARDHAARLGLTALERNAVNAHALQLELVGRADEALVLLAELEATADAAPDATACEKAEIAINLGFGSSWPRPRSANRAGARAPASATRRRRSSARCRSTGARTLPPHGHAGKPRPRRAPAWRSRSRAAALDRLGPGATEGTRGGEGALLARAPGRIALAEGDGARAGRVREEARLAASMLSFEAGWRADVGRGALELLGRSEDAGELPRRRAADRP